MSDRAHIFGKILPYIDRDDWMDYGDFIVFGEKAFEAVGTRSMTEEERQDRKVFGEIERLAAEVARQEGSGLAAERTTMDGAKPVDLANVLRGCSPRTLRTIRQFCEKTSESPVTASARAAHQDPNIRRLDNLDRHYASEVISRLERIVRLVSALDAVETDRPPVPAVREYFGEVHNCFLYGFAVACAVLCRGLLEAALEERLEPGKKRRHRKPSKQLDALNRAKSDILRWLDQAEAKGILDGSRVEAGERVKDAGDAAIHRLEEFKGYWGREEQLRLLVDDTRKVLEDLHRATPAT
jgi:hypothetical protein